MISSPLSAEERSAGSKTIQIRLTVVHRELDPHRQVVAHLVGAPLVEAAAAPVARAGVGGFVAAFLFAEIISLGGLFSDLEWGYVLAFAFFIVMMFVRPGGLLARRQ